MYSIQCIGDMLTLDDKLHWNVCLFDWLTVPVEQKQGVANSQILFEYRKTAKNIVFTLFEKA